MKEATALLILAAIVDGLVGLGCVSYVRRRWRSSSTATESAASLEESRQVPGTGARDAVG